MFEIRPAKLKRYQQYAGIAGSIGFILGSVIPAIGMMLFGWQCPFGTGVLQTIGFLMVTGFCSAILLGNLIAFLLIGIAKYQHVTRKVSKKEEDINGNRNIRY